MALAALAALMAALAPGHRAAEGEEVPLAVALTAGPVVDDLAAVRLIDALARAVSALSETQGRFDTAASQLEEAAEVARGHLHDDDALRGVPPPLSGLTVVEISETLQMWRPRLRWEGKGSARGGTL
ncbi:hypothetical protein JXA47_01885 [Candidatus Sumerlaeota bacterium]|nr:hypothetical protein [Candidatus Sumerlaeota bacterium]